MIRLSLESTTGDDRAILLREDGFGADCAGGRYVGGVEDGRGKGES